MHIPLRRVNDMLLVSIILINGYVILTPFAPKLEFWWQSKHNHAQQKLTEQLQQAPPVPGPGVTVAPHRLVVPSMLLDTPVLEGSLGNRYKVLNQGVWRWPLGSTPDKGGNTVLIGHRFTYTNPRGTLYFLDKVHLGDEIGVAWDGTAYRYKVTSVREVPPTETSIQDATPDAQITIYTCTPLWQPKHRLVVVAKLEGSI